MRLAGQHRRLDAARIMEALQNEPVRIGDAFFVLLKRRKIAIDGDDAAAADPLLAYLQPAAVVSALHDRITRTAVAFQPIFEPLLQSKTASRR